MPIVSTTPIETGAEFEKRFDAAENKMEFLKNVLNGDERLLRKSHFSSQMIKNLSNLFTSATSLADFFKNADPVKLSAFLDATSPEFLTTLYKHNLDSDLRLLGAEVDIVSVLKELEDSEKRSPVSGAASKFEILKKAILKSKMDEVLQAHFWQKVFYTTDASTGFSTRYPEGLVSFINNNDRRGLKLLFESVDQFFLNSVLPTLFADPLSLVYLVNNTDKNKLNVFLKALKPPVSSWDENRIDLILKSSLTDALSLLNFITLTEKGPLKSFLETINAEPISTKVDDKSLFFLSRFKSSQDLVRFVKMADIEKMELFFKSIIPKEPNLEVLKGLSSLFNKDTFSNFILLEKEKLIAILKILPNQVVTRIDSTTIRRTLIELAKDVEKNSEAMDLISSKFQTNSEKKSLNLFNNSQSLISFLNETDEGKLTNFLSRVKEKNIHSDNIYNVIDVFNDSSDLLTFLNNTDKDKLLIFIKATSPEFMMGLYQNNMDISGVLKELKLNRLSGPAIQLLKQEINKLILDINPFSHPVKLTSFVNSAMHNQLTFVLDVARDMKLFNIAEFVGSFKLHHGDKLLSFIENIKVNKLEFFLNKISPDFFASLAERLGNLELFKFRIQELFKTLSEDPLKRDKVDILIHAIVKSLPAIPEHLRLSEPLLNEMKDKTPYFEQQHLREMVKKAREEAQVATTAQNAGITVYNGPR